MSMYEKTICTVYAAKNGYVVECSEPAKPGKKGEPSMPSEREHVVAKTAADVLRIIKQELSGNDSEAKEYDEGFKDAVAAKSATPSKK